MKASKVSDAQKAFILKQGADADTTTRSARTGRPGTRSRCRCSIPMAQPARHREKAGKLYLPAVQRMVSQQNGQGSNRRWMKVQWHVWTASVWQGLFGASDDLVRCRHVYVL